MSSGTNTQYLESKVLTAPPQRLHLMLIEGAIRFGREAEAAMNRGESLAASIPLTRLIDILGELLAGVREKKTKLNQQIADFYTFLFRSVAEAKVNNDVKQLTEVLGLLEFERETWQMACEKIGASSAPPTSSTQAAAPIPAKPRPAIMPSFGGTAPSSSLGISLEA